MANTFAPFGFRSFGRLDGGAPTAGLSRFFIGSSDTNLYFTGDLVGMSSFAGSQAAGTNNTNVIQPYVGSSNYNVLGVFAGCEYYNSNVQRVVWSPYFPGNVGSSALVTAYIITDPDQLFIAQLSTTSSAGGSSMIGWGIGAGSTSGSSLGNTANGQSVMLLQSSVAQITPTSTLPFIVWDIYQNSAPPGTNGTSSGSEGAQILVVRPNAWGRRMLTSAST